MVVFVSASRIKALDSVTRHFPLVTILLFGPGRSHSLAPAARFERRRAQAAVKTGLLQGRRRLGLDGREHDGTLRAPGARAPTIASILIHFGITAALGQR